MLDDSKLRHTIKVNTCTTVCELAQELDVSKITTANTTEKTKQLDKCVTYELSELISKSLLITAFKEPK